MWINCHASPQQSRLGFSLSNLICERLFPKVAVDDSDTLLPLEVACTVKLLRWVGVPGDFNLQPLLFLFFTLEFLEAIRLLREYFRCRVIANEGR